MMIRRLKCGCELRTVGGRNPELYAISLCPKHANEYQDELKAIATDMAEMAEDED